MLASKAPGNSHVEARRKRRLIVTADDFGRSESVNRAVVRAHQEGILTTASLMVTEPGFDQAVEFAKQNPRLGVGLHLTLVCGHSALDHKKIPDLVNGRNEFGTRAFETGLRYFFNAGIRPQLQAEIRAQLEKFKATGLELDHVSGHLHMHMHPTVLGILLDCAAEFGIRRFRLTQDRFWLNARVAPGRWLYRAAMAIVFNQLARHARPRLAARGIKHADFVFGLLQNSRVDEAFVLGLLRRLPEGVSELYLHPAEGESTAELDAVISPKVRALIDELGIELVRYKDL
ncbi:MAG: hopanoid biosynthesis-associated protein HpnK [Verrucomicrobiae bacterium]|nr:hopanoid biosynthesis-associated protein HpnK [Verrucomicrobiae bacterium]